MTIMKITEKPIMAKSASASVISKISAAAAYQRKAL
jgi:hypothetical protein